VCGHPLDMIEFAAHRVGSLDDMHVTFECRCRACSRLIGDGWARFGWDGEKPCGWVEDPWAGAARAIREALEKSCGRVRGQDGTLWDRR
jgi:hypothetical protein